PDLQYVLISWRINRLSFHTFALRPIGQERDYQPLHPTGNLMNTKPASCTGTEHPTSFVNDVSSNRTSQPLSPIILSLAPRWHDYQLLAFGRLIARVAQLRSQRVWVNSLDLTHRTPLPPLPTRHPNARAV